MSGVTYDFAWDGLGAAQQRLAGLTVLEVDEVTYDIGQLLESSIDRRLDQEKTSPDGEAWAPWSPAYDDSRNRNYQAHSLLVAEGNLLQSVQNYTRGDEVEIGTPMVYGAVHQFGSNDDGNIPARPYLGLSDRDRIDIRRLIVDDLSEAMA